jgi:hypothetical protein
MEANSTLCGGKVVILLSKQVGLYNRCESLHTKCVRKQQRLPPTI